MAKRHWTTEALGPQPSHSRSSTSPSPSLLPSRTLVIYCPPWETSPHPATHGRCVLFSHSARNVSEYSASRNHHSISSLCPKSPRAPRKHNALMAILGYLLPPNLTWPWIQPRRPRDHRHPPPCRLRVRTSQPHPGRGEVVDQGAPQDRDTRHFPSAPHPLRQERRFASALRPEALSGWPYGAARDHN